MGLLDGKVAVVTGGGGGLGEAYSRLFAKEGAAIVVNDLGGARDGAGAGSGSNAADRVVEEIKAQGGRAVANGADVSTVEGGESILKTALDSFGKVDILINNAGILRDKTFAKMDEASWDLVVKVHLKGTFCVTLPIFKWMKDNGNGGVIVNTSSTSALFGNFGQTNYGAAKGGIAGFTRVLAIEGQKSRIRVWGLAPVAYTRMTEDLPGAAERMRESSAPDRIAPGVLYMVSNLSGDQTGKFLLVSGFGVRELKVMSAPGWTPEGPWEAQDIVTHADQIFFPETTPAR